MKKFIISIVALFATFTVNAQDILVTDDGDAIKAYNVEVATNKVYYTLTPKSEDTKSILKEKILVWKKSDGTKVVLGQTSHTAVIASSSTENHSIDRFANVAIMANKEAIEKINRAIYKYNGPKTGNAGNVYLQFNITNDSQLEDDNISISLISGNYKEDDVFMDDFKLQNHCSKKFIENFAPTNEIVYEALQINVENKSDKIIYLDLGNCFFIRNGVAETYYLNSSTSSTSSTSTGIGLNMGIVGIGGGSTKGEVKTVYAERVMAIAPKSKKSLEPILYFPLDYKDSYIRNNNIWNVPIYISEKQVNGDTMVFSKDNSPIKIGIVLNYALTQTFENSKNCFINLFAKTTIASPSPSGHCVTRKEYEQDPSSICLFCQLKKK